MFLVAIAILFFMLLPNLVLAVWLTNGTNVASAPFWHKFVVGVSAAWGILWWGTLLLGGLFAPFEHQQTVRAAAANAIHPSGIMDGIQTILKNGLTKPKVLLALAALITVAAVIFTIWGLTLEHPHDSVRPVIFTVVLAWLLYLSSAKLYKYALNEARGGGFGF